MADFDPEAFLKKYDRPPAKKRPEFDPEKFVGNVKETASGIQGFAGGAVQGAAFDPIEGIDQIIAHARGTNTNMPDSVKQWFDDYREKYSSTPAGVLGQAAGTIGSAFVPGSWIARTGVLGKGAKLSSNMNKIQSKGAPPPPGWKAAGKGAAIGGAGAVSRPIENDENMSFKDFAKKKAIQGATGALGGGIVGAPGAPQLISMAAINDSLSRFGPEATFGALGILMMPSLERLSHRGVHGIWGLASEAARTSGHLMRRPGAQWAIGSTGGAAEGPVEKNVEKLTR